MAGEKRFGTAFLGFKQSDVNSYIEKILREFDDKLKEKDNEIIILKSQFRELRIKYEDIARKSEQVGEDRAKIADVLIKAQEKAELILQEAREQAEQERRKLSEMTEQEKEKFVDMKHEMKLLKQEITKTLKKYEMDLDRVIEISESSGDIEHFKLDTENDDGESTEELLEEIMEEYVGKTNS
ncbi:MAG: hypothetical protein GX992_03855 [Clostridium sp.]|nr:hypothetical protein [Clostridium sp.]